MTFKVGTDPDMAQVLVQNKVQLATPTLPEEIKRTGVSVEKQSTSMLMVISIFSPDDQFDNLFLSNYASLNIKDALMRINGVSQVTIFGEMEYSMRVWLDPTRMASLDLTTTDVLNAIREQNVQVAAGQVGAMPSSDGTEFQYTLRARGRLGSIEEFENIILRANPDGSQVRLNAVARLELGAKPTAVPLPITMPRQRTWVFIPRRVPTR